MRALLWTIQDRNPVGIAGCRAINCRTPPRSMGFGAWIIIEEPLRCAWIPDSCSSQSWRCNSAFTTSNVQPDEMCFHCARMCKAGMCTFSCGAAGSEEVRVLRSTLCPSALKIADSSCCCCAAPQISTWPSSACRTACVPSIRFWIAVIF